MESVTFMATGKIAKWPVREKRLNGKQYSLIYKINLILEPIIGNTLKFNKLTSGNGLYETLIVRHNGTSAALDNDIDVDTIINICAVLCEDNGVLRKLKINDECFYKLNYQGHI